MQIVYIETKCIECAGEIKGEATECSNCGAIFHKECSLSRVDCVDPKRIGHPYPVKLNYQNN